MNKLLEFNARINNSKTFWWLIGAANAVTFGVAAAGGVWWRAIAALVLMAWAMYEMYRIQNLNKENKNV